MRALAIGTVAVIVAALVSAPGTTVRAAGPTTKDGVYSAPQAAHGKAAYLDICAGCHGLDLLGAPFVAPALKGVPFVENWRDDSVESLYLKIKNDMPMGSPGRMSDADKLDVLTYILQENDLPAGGQALTREALAGIVVDSPLERQPVGDTALARVIGCLVKDGKDFVLTKAAKPTRSREGLPSSEPQLKAANDVPLGTGAYKLMDADPAPDAHVGKRLDVKGILILRPEGNAVNVTALQPTGAACAP